MFTHQSSSSTWLLRVPVSGPLPCLLAWEDQDTPVLLSEGILESDRLDGSMFDSDGCEKRFRVFLDHATHEVCLETLPEDHNFWQGTERGQRLGMLGYYQHLFEESVGELNTIKEIELEDQSKDSCGTFMWSDAYAREHAPSLFSAPTSRPSP